MQPTPTQLNFEAIGTKWQIDIFDGNEVDKTLILNKIEKRIAEFDKNYSRFRKDSLVSQMASSGGEYILPDDAKILIDLYQKLYNLTNGLVTPLIGKTLEDAGYDSTYSLESKAELYKPPKWDDVIEYEFPMFKLKQPALLDFGAAGKGYLVDIIGEVLEANGVKSYCIDAGGDISYRENDKKILRIGLENPVNTNQVIGVVNLSEGSICGSATNRRKWGDFNHIINPETLKASKDILATWVKSETAILADAMATCLFFCKAGSMQSHYKFEYLILNADFSIEKSSHFDAELFTK